MKYTLLILLFASCSHKPSGPAWVTSLRSGEERLRIANGSTLLFRRIAGGYSREHACELATAHAKNDIKASFPEHEKVAHSLEVLYFDQNHQDCAVTLSVPTPVRPAPLTKSELAQKYAVNGTKTAQFERFTGERLYVSYNYKSACWRAFYEAGSSFHDATEVCWKRGEVVGFCNNLGCSRP